jgi:hypothetical protein
MPYKSAAQRGYLHAQHPEIAAKWDAEIRAKKKRKRVKKNRGDGWLKPVVAGTVAGGLANQFPRVQDMDRRRKRGAPKRKGMAKRLEAPTWPDDGFFNARAAQEAYDLVMKMDPDAAQMFVTCVVTDALEADIEANQRTLQKHLDQVVAKQFTDLKRATMRVVGKRSGEEDEQDQIGFAQALTVLESLCTVSKADDDHIPNWAFERKIRRNPGTGQFQTKVKHTQTKPINDKVAHQLGIPKHPSESKKKGALSAKEKAQYQDEYRQLANFLGAVHQSTPNPGDSKVHLHFEDHHGNEWVEEAVSTRPSPRMLDPQEKKLTAIAAYPHGLNVGGAAFGLAGAMGGGMGGDRISQINAGARGMPDFAQSWTADYGRANTNAQLYGRTAAGGKLLADVTPAGSKANLAGHFGSFVGQYGPQAEAVIGPPARKTAYRYRGTEKKPDPEMVEAYRQQINRQMASRSGFGDEDTLKATKTAQTRALKAEQNKIAEETNTPVEAVRIPNERRVEILNAAKDQVQGTSRPNKPTWQEQNAAGAAIMDYLQRPASEGGAAPQKGLYNLQLASGNTPPSEGVILDRDGQIVSQAIGYGDDHYLPFNLKNLKGLKGGSYIRNRSVGGLTSEDIYTGLVSGARRVTVVSRSGTFTMEFEPDFRGGRRHNDKAARMTRRYEQLLDAVQSEQVENKGIDPEIRRAITQKVRTQYADVPTVTSAELRAEITRRVEDYKSSPDLDAETEQYIDLVVNNRTAGMTTVDRHKIQAQVMNDVARDKEYRYRLNGNGYAAALEGLREQFPYYIKVTANPTKEPERFEPEQDRGYVEPGKIRPTAAAAGLFGGAKQPAFARMGGKVSAATADYASPFRKPAPEAPKPAEGETPKEGGEEPKKEEAKPATVEGIREQAKYEDAAVAMQQNLVEHADIAPSAETRWAKMDPTEFRAFLANKENLANFDHWVIQNEAILTGRNDPNQTAHHRAVQPVMAAYKMASGRLGQKPYERVLSQEWRDKPYAFEGKAYQAGADEATRRTELRRIKADRVGVVNLKPVSQMTDRELQQEVLAVAQVRRELGGLGTEPTLEQKKALFQGINRESPTVQSAFASPDTMDDYLEMIHRTRAVNIGVPDAERGFTVEHHENTKPPEQGIAEGQKVEEARDRMSYLAGKAMELHAEDSEEHQQLAQLKLDLEDNRDQIRTPRALEGIKDTNSDAYELIMRAVHEGKIISNEPAKSKELPPGGGPILS